MISFEHINPERIYKTYSYMTSVILGQYPNTDYEYVLLATKKITPSELNADGNFSIKDLTYHINRNMLGVMKK